MDDAINNALPTPCPWGVMWQCSTQRKWGGGHTSWEVPVCVGRLENGSLGNVIAIVHMGGKGATTSTKEAVEANARLIATAPDLLAVCELALMLIENGNFKNGVLDQTETIDEGEVKARQIYDQIRLTVMKAKRQTNDTV